MSAFLMVIEMISFLIRPFTLALRLFGNMLGGHVVVYIFATFVIGLGAFGLQGIGLNNLGLLGSGLSFMMVLALTALDFVIAIIQAFVWAALTCVYLNEVVNLDHGH
jgi:F-type H+-transporting ATPase subunit a